MTGEILSHYRILEPLGSGGMGEVFVAEDLRLGRRVALKLLPPEFGEDPDRLERLEREARTLARLKHPSIVTLYEVEEHEDRPFLVMELVEGRPLSRMIPRHGLPEGELLEIAIAVADALVAAHEAGVVHRDLKPSNVLIDDDGTVKVCDFGLAAPLPGDAEPEESTATLTESGTLVGTLPYMAPERLQGTRHDSRSDLFSFGVMLYEMAVGQRPFHGESNAELASEILRHEPPPTAELRPGLPHDLGRIVRHCLQKDPDRRYQTAKGLRSELLELREDLESDGFSEGSPSRPRTTPGRRWTVIAGLAAILLGLAVTLGIVLVGDGLEEETARGPRVEDPRARTLVEQATAYERRGDLQGDLEDAEEVLRRAARIEPENPYLKARLAALLARIQRQDPVDGRSREIEELVDEALKQNRELAPARLARAHLALMRGDWGAAEEAARRAIEIDPELVRAYGLLGEALLGQGRTEAAIEEASKALEIEGDEVWGRLVLAKVLVNAGRYNEAVSHYEEALELAPDNPNARANLGAIYVWTGRELEAIPLLRETLERYADDAVATNLGYALYNLGRYPEAADAFERAHELAPDHPTHARNLADTYEAMGDEEQMRTWLGHALEGYDRALRTGGAEPRLVAERAVALAKLGRLEEARSEIEDALSQKSSDPYVLFFAAQVAAMRGDEETLRQRIRGALAAGYPRDPFHSDPAFADYREEEWFSEILLTPQE